MTDYANYRGTVVQTGSWPKRTWGWVDIPVHIPDTISFIKASLCFISPSEVQA
jgi:hypothetical protein